MKIAIGSDNAGFHLKEAMREKLVEAGYEVMDLGTTDTANEVKYMYAADNVCKAVLGGEADKGMLFCGTGMGVSICANKHKGIYCAVVESQWAAWSARFINNANVLAMGERIVAPVMAWDIAQAFLNTEFHQGTPPARTAVLEGLYGLVKEEEEKWFG